MPCSILRSMTNPMGSTIPHSTRWESGCVLRCRVTNLVARPPSVGCRTHCHVASGPSRTGVGTGSPDTGWAADEHQ